MNKYQSFYCSCIRRLYVISERARAISISNQNGRRTNDIKHEKERDKGTNGCTFKDGVYTIYQNDNYYLKKYLAVVVSSLPCEVYLKLNGKELPVKRNEENLEEYIFTLDFDNCAESIVVKYNTKLIDPIEIPIVYVESDKEAWDKKLEEERIADMHKTVGAEAVHGESFVNIYYRPLNDMYDYAEVDLYFVNGSAQTDNIYFLANYKSNPNSCFINIPNLSYGTYEFVLKQYDRNKTIIYTSDKHRFVVKKNTPHGYGPYIAGFH